MVNRNFMDNLSKNEEQELITKLQNGLQKCPNCGTQLQFYYREGNKTNYANCPYKCLISFGFGKIKTPRNKQGQLIDQGKTENSKVIRVNKNDNLGLEVPDYDLKALTSDSNWFISSLGACVMDLPNIKELLQPNRIEVPFLEELTVGMDFHGWNNKPIFCLHTKKCLQTKYCEQKDLNPSECSNQGCF